MDTSAQVHSALTTGAARFEAAKLAKEANVHSFMGKLRALYETWYGRVGLDIHDWHWQATALKNHLKANGDPHDDATHADADAPGRPLDAAPHATYPASSEPRAPLEPVSPGLPHASHPSLGMGDAPATQGVDHPVSTIAPGTPTSLGDPLPFGKPDSIKPKPDANDPTDTSFIKTTPDVTTPVQGGVTATPGSPARATE